MEVSGTFVQQLESKTGTGRNGDWIKREFVIQQPGQYGKAISITVFNDKGDLIEGLAEGEPLTVEFELESREYNSKWYTTITAKRITVTSTGASSGGGSRPAPAPVPRPAPAPVAAASAPKPHSGGSDFEGDFNDLPF